MGTPATAEVLHELLIEALTIETQVRYHGPMRAHKLQVQIPGDHHLLLSYVHSCRFCGEMIILTQTQERRRIFKDGGWLSANGLIEPGDPVAAALRGT